MNNEKFLQEVERRGFCVMDVSCIHGDLVRFLDWVCELPVPRQEVRSHLVRGYQRPRAKPHVVALEDGNQVFEV